MNRLKSLNNELSDMDISITNAECKDEMMDVTNIANHHLLRHIAVNTALLVDLMDLYMRTVLDINTNKKEMR